MIPLFPQFKKIEVSDRKDVEAHTHKYDPYSDFNFTSLYAWDTNGERTISELNGNLVVKFTDYSTHEPFLSFLGAKEVEHTARTLIEYCKENALPTTLKLMPEVSVQGIRPSILRVDEDRDNFDYIYSIHDLALLKGEKYRSKKRPAATFRLQHPDAHVETIDLAHTGIRERIASLISVWGQNKVNENKQYELEHEQHAIERLIDTATAHTLFATGIFSQDKFLAFRIEELLPNQYSIGHFWKANNLEKGIYDFLTQETSHHLETLGIESINMEQDLGIESLRRWKMSYRPSAFLKKYTLSLA